MRSVLNALGLSVLFFLPAAGQPRPNFSGSWIETGNPHREFIEIIVHQDANLTISTVMREKPGPPTTLQRPTASLWNGPVTYVIEGPERTAKDANSQGWTSVYWQDSSLVIEKVRKERYRIRVIREVLTLSDEGNTLRHGRRTVDMDGVTESTRILHRQ